MGNVHALNAIPKYDGAVNYQSCHGKKGQTGCSLLPCRFAIRGNENIIKRKRRRRIYSNDLMFVRRNTAEGFNGDLLAGKPDAET